MSIPVLMLMSSLSGLCLLVLIALILKFQRPNDSIGIVKTKTRQLDSKWLLWAYDKLSSNLLTRRYVLSIRERLIITSDNDEKAVREQTVVVYSTATTIVSVIMVLFAIFVREWYLWMVLIITLFFVSETIVDFFVNRVKIRLLEQLISYIEQLRNQYFQSGMIDEAFSDAMDGLNPKKNHDVLKQANLIHEILISSDGETLLNAYYQTAPNKYLKLLAGIAFIIKEFGDTTIEGASLFAKSLTHLSSELRDEVIIRDKLNFGLKSMNFIALVPLFAMKPIRAWASNSFYPLMQFYEGPLGFVVEISVLIIILISYAVLRKIQNFHEEESRKSENHHLERWMMKHFSKPIEFMVPQKHSKAYKRTDTRMKSAMVYIPIEWHYVQKCSVAVACASIALLIIVATIMMGTQSVYKTPTTPSGFLAGELKGKALEEAQETTAIDNEILRKTFAKMTRDELMELIKNDYEYSGEKLRVTTSRISDKLKLLDNYQFDWTHVLIIYVMCLIGWYAPDVMLLVRKKIAQSDLESEVSKFQLIIMMMMRIESVSVDFLLEWLERFSFVLKEPIQRAIMDYDAGAEEALERLKGSTENEDFHKLVSGLVSAVNKLSIHQAFDELETEKLYYVEKRRIQNERMVSSKISAGQIIGFTPTYALVVLYFMIPLVYASVAEMQTYFDKLSL
ncbi:MULTISPECIES: hypothetical protein [unclassified Fusibacter]|uniref:hypothetical protein n=1 Tax=unclassified Fusibacter TaxID=2624464 RepID=UPI0010110B2E|nr:MULTISPECIES: hypothetical protein [unclassified Fusibacter]MCK8060833.1 hypothetical protein [Fusibacter sp. A2]NPE23129.1 hypothetical protein [Fusibacter sp. A1]RXV59801.1 hypothetical protein DWB64_14955 [Fusibacter sp. A1]